MTSGERHLIIWNVSILVYSELGTLGAPFESFKGLWGWGSAVSDLHGSHSNCTSISLLRHAWGKLERNVIILLILFNVFMGDIISHFVISTTHFYTSSKLLSPITSPTGHATSSFSWTDDAPPNAGILPQRPERRVVMRHKIWVKKYVFDGIGRSPEGKPWVVLLWCFYFALWTYMQRIATSQHQTCEEPSQKFQCPFSMCLSWPTCHIWVSILSSYYIQSNTWSLKHGRIFLQAGFGSEAGLDQVVPGRKGSQLEGWSEQPPRKRWVLGLGNAL